MTEQEKKYTEMYGMFHKGLISKEEWYRYCTAILYILMTENKDVFERLKIA